MPESYAHIHKTLTRAIKLDLNIWRDTLCSWIGRLNVVKISVLYKINYRFNEILIKVAAPGCELATAVGTPTTLMRTASVHPQHWRGPPRM